MKDFLIVGGIFTAIFFLMFAVISAIVYPINWYSCSARWSGTYSTQYGLMSGCRVYVQEKWIPEKNLREF